METLDCKSVLDLHFLAGGSCPSFTGSHNNVRSMVQIESECTERVTEAICLSLTITLGKGCWNRIRAQFLCLAKCWTTGISIGSASATFIPHRTALQLKPSNLVFQVTTLLRVSVTFTLIEILLHTSAIYKSSGDCIWVGGRWAHAKNLLAPIYINYAPVYVCLPGTRYSSPLCSKRTPKGKKEKKVPFQLGINDSPASHARTFDPLTSPLSIALDSFLFSCCRYISIAPPLSRAINLERQYRSCWCHWIYDHFISRWIRNVALTNKTSNSYIHYCLILKKFSRNQDGALGASTRIALLVAELEFVIGTVTAIDRLRSTLDPSALYIQQ